MSVQNTIITGIREQLYHHNYLVLPSFGGFVLQSRPAHFSSTGAQLIPPAKILSFNAQLRQNDGILSSWLQKKLSCPADEAATHIREFSDYCLGVLKTRRRLSLQGIGFFFMDFEDNLCFEPQQDVNFMTESFGLAPVTLREIFPADAPQRTRTVFRDRMPEVVPSLPLKQTRRYGKMIEPALFIIIFVSLLLLFVSNTRMNGRLYSALSGTGTSGLYVPSSYPPLSLNEIASAQQSYVADANGVAMITLDEKTIPVHVNAAENSETGLISDRKANAAYQVVLGCFSVERNAMKLVGQLKQKRLSSFISGRNAKGMYVVSAGGFNDHSKALHALNKVKAVVPNAWIKRP
jgi:hypothetical protein